ncbi:MAG TPA: hypothetical protein VFN30_01755 [Chitinophagaceae bacterium]|nr:hypothetical protein [Chitinophagaceae bacterium]
MKASKIHNLDTLEKEIYRLKLHGKKMEGKIDDDFDYLRENFGKMARNSFFHKREGLKETITNGITGSFVKSERLQQAIDKIVNHLVDKATDGIDSLLDRLFQKK